MKSITQVISLAVQRFEHLKKILQAPQFLAFSKLLSVSVFCQWHLLILAFIYVARVYPYLCRAVRNFAKDRGQIPEAKEFYVSFTDVSSEQK